MRTVLSSDAGSNLFVSPLKDVGPDVPQEQSSSKSEAICSSKPSLGTVDRRGAWIVAHLQRILLPTSAVVFVLHWHLMPSDPYTVGKAMAQRRFSLGGGMGEMVAAPLSAVAIAAEVAEVVAKSAQSGGAQLFDPSAVSPTPFVPDARASEATARIDRPLPIHAKGSATPTSGSVRRLSDITALILAGETESANPLRLPGTPLEAVAEGGGVGDAFASTARMCRVGALPAAAAEAVNHEAPVLVGSRHSSHSDASGATDVCGGVLQAQPLEQFAHGSRTAVAIHDVRGDGDRGSYASSKQSYGGKLQDKVRRVLSSGVGSLIPGLRLLRWVALLVTLLTIALGISLGAFIYSSLGAYSTTLSIVSESSRAMIAMLDANRNMRSLLFCNLVSCVRGLSAGCCEVVP